MCWPHQLKLGLIAGMRHFHLLQRILVVRCSDDAVDLRQMELLVPSELVMCWKANRMLYEDAGRVRVATAGLFSRA